MVIVVDVCCLRIIKDSISNITARRQLSVMLPSYYLGLNSKTITYSELDPLY